MRQASSPRNSKGMGTGGVSLLIIFVVLCAVIFGTLSLFLAEADLNMSSRAKASVEDYYAADAVAVRKAAEIAGAIASYEVPQTSGIHPNVHLARQLNQTVEGIMAEFDADSFTVRIRFNVPVDGIRTLSVVLRAGDGAADSLYAIETWSVVTDNSDFFTGDGGELWDGETDDDWFIDWDD